MRVLVTGAGGPAAVSVWKSLAAEHELLLADMDPDSPGLYLVPAVRRFLIPRGESPELVPTLLALCRAHSVEVLISTVDAELAPVAEAEAAFAAIGTRVPLSPADVLHRCRDKWSLLSHLSGNPFVPSCVQLSAETLPTITPLPLLRQTACRLGLAGHCPDRECAGPGRPAAGRVVPGAGTASGAGVLGRCVREPARRADRGGAA